MKTALVLFSVFILTVLGAACGGTLDQSSRTEPQQGPVRICVLQDLTGSIRKTRTVVVTPEDLRLLAEIVKARTGELGFGIIGERSDLPLVRLTLLESPPPEPPARPPGNPIRQGAWQRQWREYEEQRTAYDQRVQQQVEAFVKAAEARLQGKLDRVSDVCGGIHRCDLMLAEPAPHHVERFMVLITDGLHNVRSSRCPDALSSGAQVLLVNGEGILGVVERYAPVRFESLEAALRFIRNPKKPTREAAS